MAQAAKTISLADGRLQRSERSREAIVQAVLELVRDGDLRPTAERVAGQAGVGIRTVFRHFSDMDTLFAQLHKHLEAEILPLLEKPRPGSLPDRVSGMVSNRAALFERLAPFKRSDNLLRWRSDFLQNRHADMVRTLREHLLEWLPELHRKLADRLEACELISSFEAWDRLRVDQKLSCARATSVTEHALLALLRR